jgi:hypothetical protein
MATKIVGTCALCLADNVELTQEHIIPFALGGRFEWPGLCAKCNNDILGGKTDKPMAEKNPLMRLERLIRHLPSRGKSARVLSNVFDDAEGTIGNTNLRFKGSRNGKPFVRPQAHLEILPNGDIKLDVASDPSVTLHEVRQAALQDIKLQYKSIFPDATDDEVSRFCVKIGDWINQNPGSITEFPSSHYTIMDVLDEKMMRLFFARVAYEIACFAHTLEYARASSTAAKIRKALLSNDHSALPECSLIPPQNESKSLCAIIDYNRYNFIVMLDGVAIISVLRQMAIVRYEETDDRFMYEIQNAPLFLFEIGSDATTTRTVETTTLSDYMNRNSHRLIDAFKANKAHELMQEYIKCLHEESRHSNGQNTVENHAHKKDSSSYLGLISAALSPPSFIPSSFTPVQNQPA